MKDLTVGVLDLCFILSVFSQISFLPFLVDIVKYHKTVNKVIFAALFHQNDISYASPMLAYFRDAGINIVSTDSGHFKIFF